MKMASLTTRVAVCLIAGAVPILVVLNILSPMFLDSRIERLYEKGLPKALIRNGSTVYCRMQADDFQFPLPPDSEPFTPIITAGGFDWVDGMVQVRFPGANRIIPAHYEAWLANRLQVGATVTAAANSQGLLITFHYFGDK